MQLWSQIGRSLPSFQAGINPEVESWDQLLFCRKYENWSKKRLEMQAYSCWQGGTLCFKTSKLAEAQSLLTKAKIIYGSLSKAVGEKDGAPQHRLQEPGRERRQGGGGAAHQHPGLAQGVQHSGRGEGAQVIRSVGYSQLASSFMFKRWNLNQITGLLMLEEGFTC